MKNKKPASKKRPVNCECDNTHEQNHTCCQACWKAGFREIEVSPPEYVEVTVKLPRTTVRLLEVLVTNQDRSVAEVLETLADHAQQGVYRPGAWERGWLEQVFFSDWQNKLERGDPYSRDDEALSSFFTRPKGWNGRARRPLRISRKIGDNGPAPANRPTPPKGNKS